MTATAILSPLGPLSLARVRALRGPRIPKRAPAESRFNEYVIDVDFETPDGEQPQDRVWLVARWNHVHGE